MDELNRNRFSFFIARSVQLINDLKLTCGMIMVLATKEDMRMDNRAIGQLVRMVAQVSRREEHRVDNQEQKTYRLFDSHNHSQRIILIEFEK